MVLNVSSCSKKYGQKIAVDNLSFSIRSGEIVGLLGPNGAGKSTTLNMILGVLAPTQGEIEIDGVNLQRERSKAMERTNFVAVYSPLPGNLTLRQNLKVFAMLYGLRNIGQRIEELSRQFELTPFLDTKCGLLSSGEQARAAMAKAMLNYPRLLLLDEPTSSLDPAKANDIRAKIREVVNETQGAVLWTSHNMAEVENWCDRVLFLSRGKIILEGNPRSLAQENGKKNIEELFIAVAKEPLGLSRDKV